MVNRTLSMGEVVTYARAGGFTGNAIRVIVSIAWAESGWQTQPKDNKNSNGTVDRGILQINSIHDSNFPATSAYDPAKAFAYAFRLSRGGTYWGDWSATYGGKAYNTIYNSIDINANNNTVSGSIGNNMSTIITNVNPGSVPNIDITAPGSGITESGYKYVLAYSMFFLIIYFVTRSRIGYNTVYYLLLLALFTTIVTQSKFIASSLQPIIDQTNNYTRNRLNGGF